MIYGLRKVTYRKSEIYLCCVKSYRVQNEATQSCIDVAAKAKCAVLGFHDFQLKITLSDWNILIWYFYQSLGMHKSIEIRRRSFISCKGFQYGGV